MPQNIVVIGAVALGPKAACRFKRLEPDSSVTMVDMDDLISYGGCGIPYFISGDISDPDQLQETSFHMLRDEKFFHDTKDIEVLTSTRAISIDRNARKVQIEDIRSGKKKALPYDKLVLATGSRPRELPVPGSDLERIYAISNLNKAIAIKDLLTEGKVEKAVIVGAGAIGLEIAEALTDLWGIETTVVEMENQILPGIISPSMAKMAQTHMQENGIEFLLGDSVERFEGNSSVERVITGKNTLEADLVIIAAGVVPNSDLARQAGLDISSTGAIMVNSKLQTSDPLIYAGGDCIETVNLITGKPGYWPLGSLANRQGRVIGTNLAGGDSEFKGAVGSFVIKLFDISVANAGLSLERAKREGFDAINGFVAQFDRAHFYPEKDLMYLELIVEKVTGRVLGIHGLGTNRDATAGRINAVAPLLKYGIKTSDISNLEIAYAPPFSAAMDILNALGNTAENILAGKNRVVDAEVVADWWEGKTPETDLFLDCREWGNAEPFVEKYPDYWKSVPQGQLRERLSEIPRDKRIVLICNTGVRSYEAQITLDQEGIRDTYNLQGGIAALKNWGLDLLE